VKSESISLEHICIILDFSLAIPGTSADKDKVFSITNALWAGEKNRFLVQTTKVVVVTIAHFQDLSCNDFHTLVSDNSKVLQAMCLFQKYKTSAEEDEPTLSTLAGNV
jgi:hypothetical protein